MGRATGGIHCDQPSRRRMHHFCGEYGKFAVQAPFFIGCRHAARRWAGGYLPMSTNLQVISVSLSFSSSTLLACLPLPIAHPL